MRTTTAALGALTVALLAGCVNLRPELYELPTQAQLDAAGSAFYSGPVNGTLQQYLDYTNNLSAWHQTRANELRRGNGTLAELGFLAAVTGVIAGATEHIQSARNALGVGAATSVVGDRYQLAVQAAAYEAAANSFFCMRERIADARALEQAEEGARGLRAGSVDYTKAFPQVSVQVRESVVNVVRKLQVKLRTMDVPTPDLSKLKAALARDADTGTAAFSTKSLMANNLNPDAITRLRSNIQACEATFN